MSLSHTTTSGSPVFTAAHRKAGVVVETPTGRVWENWLNSAKHMLRAPLAWATCTEALRQARAHGATWCVWHDSATGLDYRAPVDYFDAHGLPVNRGFGDQRALPLRWWSTADPTAAPTTGAPTATSEPTWQQTSFLGGDE